MLTDGSIADQAGKCER